MADTDYSLAKVLAGFALGAASSAAVAILIYKQQKRDAEASEQRLVLLIERKLRESGTPFSTMRELSLHAEELRRSFDDLRDHLLTAPKTRSAEAVLDLASQYSDVARSIAGDATERVVREESLPLSLTVEWLQDLHRRVFPRGYELSGRIRTIAVWIGPIGSSPASANFRPPPPGDVPDRLRALLSRWNGGWASMRASSVKAQAFEVARFHHELVSIHPFVDGNGVLARATTELQIKALAGAVPRLIRSRPEYYAALQQADGGSFDMLVRILQETWPS